MLLNVINRKKIIFTQIKYGAFYKDVVIMAAILRPLYIYT